MQQILLSQFSDDEVEIIYLPQGKGLDVYGNNWMPTMERNGICIQDSNDNSNRAQDGQGIVL